MVSRYPVIFLLTIFLFGCNSASPSPTPAPASEIPALPATATVASPTVVPDYVTTIGNAQYQLGITDTLRVVQLVDGEYKQGAIGGADYVFVNVTDFVATGDLNGDGSMDEVVALIAENYGGSGVFVFLAEYEDVNGTLNFLSSVLLDDRPQLNELSIDGGEIVLSAITHATDDPMCCPTLQTTRRYRLLLPTQLEMTEYTTFTRDGRPRTITINVPIHGAEVYSSFQLKGSVAIAPFENNLVYRIYDLGGVELASGSVTVDAPELGGPGTFDSIIELGNILSGSVVRVEIQDISAADGSLLAMDSVELVVK